MTPCIIVILSYVLTLFIFVYPFIRYKTIKYIGEDTRIVKNIFTGIKYEQACDHYGWFNMNRVRDFDIYHKKNKRLKKAKQKSKNK